jgi:tetratricopeptide (TPR) repeat protein
MAMEPLNDWTDAETHVERAHKLYERGRWLEAAAELRAAIEINPYNPSWYFNLALTQEALGDYERACESFGRALKLDGDDVEMLNCLAVNLTRLGRYAEALRRFQRIDELDPNYEPAYCNRITTYAEIGDHDKAELMFYRARQIKEECPQCYYNIGGSLYARGQYDRAIYCWRQTLRLDPSHPYANVRIAETFWAKGDLRQAREHYLTELQSGRTADVETLLDFGELLMELGDLAEAEKTFRQALAQAPDDASVHFCLGELFLRTAQNPTAETHFRKVLAIDERYPCAHLKLAEALVRRGRMQEGAKHLILELRQSGDDRQTLKEVGKLLLEAHRSRQANRVLGRLARLQPDDPHVQHNLAVSYFMLQQLPEGIRCCRRALKLKPDYPLALYNLALAHMRMGQMARARRYAARAVTVAPANENIRRLARRLGAMSFWSRLRNRLNLPADRAHP